MLKNAEIAAIIPVRNVDAAIRFYEGTLGLTLAERRDDLPENPEAEFTAANGRLSVYQSAAAGRSEHTLAAFRIAELEPVVAALRERGVVFEDYDLPGLKTEQGIITAGDSRAAWFKDPDGNIVAIESTVAP